MKRISPLPQLPPLSDDAKQAAVLFNTLASPVFHLTFNTPSRIHPRMRAALTELVNAGCLTEDQKPLAEGHALDFYVEGRQLAFMEAVPKMSLAKMKVSPLPVAVN